MTPSEGVTVILVVFVLVLVPSLAIDRIHLRRLQRQGELGRAWRLHPHRATTWVRIAEMLACTVGALTLAGCFSVFDDRPWGEQLYAVHVSPLVSVIIVGDTVELHAVATEQVCESYPYRSCSEVAV